MKVVWYDRQEDKIILSTHLDAMFFSMLKFEWQRFDILGEL